MLGTLFAANQESPVAIDEAELDRYLVDQDSPIGLLTRVAPAVQLEKTPAFVDHVGGFPGSSNTFLISAGVLTCSCRTLCRIGRPLSFASASPVGAAHRLFDQRDVRHIAGTSGLQLTILEVDGPRTSMRGNPEPN